jgi:hypothetical protein
MTSVSNQLDGNAIHDEARARGQPELLYWTMDEYLWQLGYNAELRNPTSYERRYTEEERAASHDKMEELFQKYDVWRQRWKPTKAITHAGHELGAREFTLTYSPKWMTDIEAKAAMEKAINRLIGYYENEIVELRAIGEVGSNGLSHIHCFYQLIGGLKITDKNFKRAWKFWNPKKKLGSGFEGGHHATVRHAADFRGYIDKEIDTAWLEKNINNRHNQ